MIGIQTKYIMKAFFISLSIYMLFNIITSCSIQKNESITYLYKHKYKDILPIDFYFEINFLTDTTGYSLINHKSNIHFQKFNYYKDSNFIIIKNTSNCDFDNFCLKENDTLVHYKNWIYIMYRSSTYTNLLTLKKDNWHSNLTVCRRVMR